MNTQPKWTPLAPPIYPRDTDAKARAISESYRDGVRYAEQQSDDGIDFAKEFAFKYGSPHASHLKA